MSAELTLVMSSVSLLPSLKPYSSFFPIVQRSYMAIAIFLNGTLDERIGSGKLGQNAWACDEDFINEITALAQSHDKLIAGI